ncbi:hypothetical protein JGH11_10985 [Dysgonomonas sp. Marseille-P4677]|uniref:DUF6291 domain-containing protein n=1 Tax=Dysgonomonas sp. Marseille-P4677 TaxID=2364790 RepID=UPI001911F15C|nr:DUF6291 domain-containing protein [Dysgonomonas sp. Marseille-P4677]MBK5721398.1 hypothetical protein [Dysgonomonas sp. Marseille-P4677]
MERESFVFYRSWFEAISHLPREIQGEVLTAIIEYGLNGETTASLKPIAKAMLTMVIPQIDINNKRYENGKKGGRPPTEEKPSVNQNKTKVEPNVNDNVYVNDNDIKEISSNEDIKKTHTDFEKFSEWIKANAPYCANIKNFSTQISEESFLKLKGKYSGNQIAEVISQIENRKDLRKKYTDLYRTVLNWLKKEYG